MDFNNIDSIKKNGFQGFKPVEELWLSKKIIPTNGGVYLVIQSEKNTEFQFPGVGGFYKAKDPNVSRNELQANFIQDSLILYIGKADGKSERSTLSARISSYLRFGQGKACSHTGGRFIWQLKNHKELLFCWKETPNENPKEIEKQLLQKYTNDFGKRPFANLKG